MPCDACCTTSTYRLGIAPYRQTTQHLSQYLNRRHVYFDTASPLYTPPIHVDEAAMAGIISRFRRLNENNVATFRRAPLTEVSGSLGDLGTLLPLMIALAIQDSIQLSSTLVFTGIFNILTGAFFGIPLPVQPMKVGASYGRNKKSSRMLLSIYILS